MVQGAPPRLTGIGFRRDIKLFLAALVGFLVLIILTLLALLQSFMLANERSRTEQWSVVARAAVAEIERAASPSGLDATLPSLRARYPIAAIEVETPAGVRISSGTIELSPAEARLSRLSRAGRVTIAFDDSAHRALRAKFRAIALIALLSTAGGTVLLLLYVPKIIRPIEAMLDHASEVEERSAGVDEAHYLVETFRKSIDTMKTQEAELKRLHESEKARADELELVSRALTRSISSGFLALSAGGTIVEVNDAARRMLGLEEGEEIAGLTPARAFGRSSLARLLDDLSERRVTLARREIEISRRGSHRLLDVGTIPLFDPSGSFLGMLVLLNDLTELRQLESRVRELQALADLGEISAGIAHEFRNSLATILGYLKLARRGEIPPESATRLEKAEEEARALSEAVEGLLAFARPMNVERTPLDVRALVENVVERLSLRLEAIDLSIHGETFAIDGDAPLLGRAIENIIRNAAEAIERRGSGGRIEIELSRSRRPSIVFSDDGEGIDEAEVPRLFLPFQSGRSGGAGLGLPLARKIVLLHGGAVRMEGAPGQGTRVTVEFG
jgi:PAS domain S-box-containing protein